MTTPRKTKCVTGEHARRGSSPPASNAMLDGAARMLEAAGDAQRLRLLVLLCDGPKTVGELAAATGRASSLVSQQLAILRMSRLVRGERRGRFVSYRLFDGHTQTFIASAVEHAQHCRGKPVDS